MSNICSNNVKLSGLAEGLEKFYDRIKDLVLLNQNLYKIVFDSEVDIKDWGSDWTIFHSKDYEYGNFAMDIVCESEIEPSFLFWQNVSKEFELVIEISYFDLDIEFFHTLIFSDGDVVNDEKISSLEYLYSNNRDAFWQECYDEKWDSFGEILSKLKNISPFFIDGELNKLREIFENKYT